MRLLALIALAGVLPLSGQASLPKQGVTRQQADEILIELRQIRGLLAQLVRQLPASEVAPMPTRVRMFLGADDPPPLGSASAPVVVVEFADLQCDFCRQFAVQTFPAIRKEFIATGRVQFMSRDLPLAKHPYAEQAAEAARCAGAQGKFWPFRAAVLASAGPPTPAALEATARSLGLDLAVFRACLSAGAYRRAVAADAAEAARLGLRGTPAFIIGRVGGAYIEGIEVIGNKPLAVFRRAIAATSEDGK